MDKQVTASICTLPRRVDQTGSPERLLSSGGPQKRSLPPLEIGSLNKLTLAYSPLVLCPFKHSNISFFHSVFSKAQGSPRTLGRASLISRWGAWQPDSEHPDLQGFLKTFPHPLSLSGLCSATQAPGGGNKSLREETGK